MAQQALRGGSKKGRKRLLCQMKKRVGVARALAKRHGELVETQGQRTTGDWTRAKGAQTGSEAPSGGRGRPPPYPRRVRSPE